MKIAVAVIVVLALALGTAGTVYGFTEAGKVAAQARQIRHDEAMLRSMSQRESSLANQVVTLNVPTDPLSAYNSVCNQQMTNQSSGVTQTYWLPCTNSAQTIPQPGNWAPALLTARAVARVVLGQIPDRFAATHLVGDRLTPPGPAVRVRGPRRGAIAPHPRHDHPARSPLVPVRAL